MMTGHHDEARPAFEEALELNLAQGAIGRANDNRVALGHLDRLAGDLRHAAVSYRTALIEARSIDDATRMLMQLRAIGPLASAAGRHREAVLLAGAIERAREEQGGTLLVPLPGISDVVEEARGAHAMTETQITGALGEGRAMDLQAAVELALSLLAKVEHG